MSTPANALDITQVGVVQFDGVNSFTGVAPGTDGNLLTSIAGVWASAAPATSGTVTSVSGTTNRITSTGGNTPVIDISAAYVGQTSITTLGTVVTGVWNATAITSANGGTGANNTPTSGKVLIGNGTNFVTSTPGYPNASATSGKIIKSDGTNWVASTETYAAPSTSGNVMTSDGTNWTSAAPASGKGFTLQMQCIGTGSSPADSTTYFLAYSQAVTSSTASGTGTQRLYVPVACTLKAVYGFFRVGGTLGSAENCTFAIRINNTTDVTVTSTLKMTAIDSTFSNSGLSTSMSAGDYIEFKLTTPAWVTNPTTVGASITVYFT